MANLGNIAEALTGAALFAKFTNRPKGKKDEYPELTVDMVEDVLHNYFSGTSVGKVLKKTVSDVKKTVISKPKKDNITLQIDIPTADRLILSNKKARAAKQIQDKLDDVVKYVQQTWESDALEFARNNEIDSVDIHSDGVGDQTATKADIKILHNGEKYTRQISLKVTGGDQFAQVSGEDFSKQIKLWETLDIDVSKFQKNYETILSTCDTSMVFESRENKQLEKIKKTMKKAAHVIYQHAAKEMKKKLNGKNKDFYEILAKLIFDSATRGDETIELVKLEKGFSRIVFSNDFKKRYADLLSKQKITVVFNDEGDPIVAVYVGTVNTKNKLFQIRVKVEAASSKTAAGKKYKPYMRNYIESGKKMFELAEQLHEIKN